MLIIIIYSDILNMNVHVLSIWESFAIESV